MVNQSMEFGAQTLWNLNDPKFWGVCHEPYPLRLKWKVWKLLFGLNMRGVWNCMTQNDITSEIHQTKKFQNSKNF
jgi:hypothetical protein